MPTLELLPNFFANRFAPKLTFGSRCSIFTLHHYKQINMALLAEAFGIHHKTVLHICNQKGKLYKDVHREAERLGLVAMYEQYVHDEDIIKVNRAQNARNERQVTKRSMEPSKAHNKHEGTHAIRRRMTTIRWLDELDGRQFGGWAYDDNDGLGFFGDPDNAGKPFHTSSECYRFCLKQTM
jgi:monoamine oxidase